jgi:hypothetical protein
MSRLWKIKNRMPFEVIRFFFGKFANQWIAENYPLSTINYSIVIIIVLLFFVQLSTE